jgi:hypothetical protein
MKGLIAFSVFKIVSGGHFVTVLLGDALFEALKLVCLVLLSQWKQTLQLLGLVGGLFGAVFGVILQNLLVFGRR